MSREKRQRERERQAPHRAGSPTRDSIPRPWDQDPSQRQPPKQPSHPGIRKKTLKVGINIKKREQEQGGGAGGEREADSPLSREPGLRARYQDPEIIT